MEGHTLPNAHDLHAQGGMVGSRVLGWAEGQAEADVLMRAACGVPALPAGAVEMSGGRGQEYEALRVVDQDALNSDGAGAAGSI